VRAPILARRLLVAVGDTASDDAYFAASHAAEPGRFRVADAQQAMELLGKTGETSSNLEFL
jgi:hypothetical protein